MLVGDRELKVNSLIRTNDLTLNLDDIHYWTLALDWESIEWILIHTEQTRDEFIWPNSMSDQPMTSSVYG